MTNPVNSNYPGHLPGTCLAALVHRARGFPSCRLDEESAYVAQNSLTMGMRVIAKLMTCAEAVEELSPHELTSLGDFLWTVTDTCYQLGLMMSDCRMEEVIAEMKKEVGAKS